MKLPKSVACFVCALSSLLVFSTAGSGLCDESDKAEAAEKKKKEEGFRDLFNKKDLGGWASPYDWGDTKVVDEEIQLRGNKKFFLMAKKEFADFIFEGEVLMPDAESNSGFMFRCAIERNNAWGYQAEVDPSARGWSGGLYDEARRGWLHPKKGDEKSENAFREQGNPFKPGEWNHYRIHAEGDHLRIWVNGQLTTDFHDSMNSQGYIGIQHHGEAGKVYRFRNLRIKEMSTALGEEIVLFDGKTLKGFTDAKGDEPGAGWVVDGDAIHLKEPGKAGDLFVKGDWKNFELTFEWKIAEGARGGVGYRFAPEGEDGKLEGPIYAFLDQEKNKKQADDKRRRSGALLGIVGAHKDGVPKKIGEYNKAKIVVYRDDLTHALNDKNTVRIYTESASWRRLIKKSKHAKHKDFATQKGKIVLLDLGAAPVWIKNLKARILR